STISGPGTVDIDGNSIFSNHDFIDAATLNNFGTVTDSATITMSGGAVMNNESRAFWNMAGRARVLRASDLSGTFNNLGTLTALGAAAGVATIAFNSSNLVQVQTGTLTIMGDGIDSGTFTIAAGTSMTFSAGSDTFTNGLLVNG